MRFESPEAFLLLLLLPFLFPGAIRRSVFGKKTLLGSSMYISSPLSLEEIPKSFKQKIEGTSLNALKLLSLCFLIFALARPQTGSSYMSTEFTGRDILLVLDLSGSMKALDFTLNSKRVNRLEALKSVVKDFIEKRNGDRLGLIVFGSEVFTQAPLTRDIESLIGFVDKLEIGMAGEHTAIGDAITLGLKRIRDIESKSKTLVLITDGQNTAGRVKPRDAAILAKEEGVKVYTVGIGSQDKVPYPSKDWLGRDRLQFVSVVLDEALLQEIATVSNGKYFNATNTEELKQVYSEIDKLEERAEEALEFTEYDEHFFGFLLLGVILFSFHEILSSTVFLRVP